MQRIFPAIQIQFIFSGSGQPYILFVNKKDIRLVEIKQSRNSLPKTNIVVKVIEILLHDLNFRHMIPSVSKPPPPFTHSASKAKWANRAQRQRNHKTLFCTADFYTCLNFHGTNFKLLSETWRCRCPWFLPGEKPRMLDWNLPTRNQLRRNTTRQQWKCAKGKATTS